MKPKNFPGRKLRRQAKADGRKPTAVEMEKARGLRTKKAGGRTSRSL